MKRFCSVISVLLLSAAAFAQSDEILPNENLVAEGIPKIPASLAESVARYSEFRAAAFASWHPTKREMLIETRFADTFQVHLVKFPGGARTQLTFFPDRIAEAQYEPTKGDSFLFSKDVGGGEFFQIYRYDLGDGNITLLTTGRTREIALPMDRPSAPAPTSISGSSTPPILRAPTWLRKMKEAAGKSPTGRQTENNFS
jgi:hypothetical protein